MRFLYILTFVLFLCVNVSINGASKAPRVLYLGDSLSYKTFGYKMEEFLSSLGFDVILSITGGGSPYYWLKQYPVMGSDVGYWEKTSKVNIRKRRVDKVPKINDLLDKYKPSLVVIQTGTNLYSTLRSKSRSHKENIILLESMFKNMCKVIRSSGALSYWITPPDSHDKKYPKWLQDEFAQIMKRSIKKFDTQSDFFESHKYTEYTAPYPKNDGIHYSPSEYIKWANLVSTKMKRSRTVNTAIGKKKREGFGEAYLASNDINKNQLIKVNAGNKKEDFIIKKLIKKEENSYKVIDLKVNNDEALNTGDYKILDDSGKVYTFLKSKNSQNDIKFIPSDDPITVQIELKDKSTVESVNEVNYNRAFALYNYKVKKVLKGNYPFGEIRLVRLIVKDRKFTESRKEKIGNKFTVKLVPLSNYPSLNTVQIIDDLPNNLNLPIYIPKI